MNYIKTYYNLIASKKIVVSQKIKKQYEKIVYDIDKPGKYHFDISRANRPIEFIEKFCKHSKGKWAGKPIKLGLWQKALVQSIFGFIDNNGNRKYKEVLVVVARKNGKSTLLSAIALYMMFADKEGGAQVCCVASKKDQAKIVFNEAKNMVIQSPLLSKHIKKRKSDLYVPLTFSTFEPLASDSNTLDGLNMHCGIIDELHSIKDRNIYDISKQSMGTRSQPLLIMITTAGFVRENIYDSMYEYATDVVNDMIEDERFLAFIYELDSKDEWQEEEYWIKANPGLGEIKSLDYLKENVKRGVDDKNFMPTLLTKDFNISETVAGSWLSFDIINNTENYDIKEFKDIYALGGADLSSTTDLTCATLIWERESRIYVDQMYFIPEDIVKTKIKQDKVPYDIWEKQGWVRFTPGTKIDYTYVTEWFVEMRDVYGIYPLWIGYDRWGSQYWVNDMINNGFTMEEVIQGAKTMSTPMKVLESEFMSNNVIYNNNPVMKWCLTNTQIQRDVNENIRPIKGRSSKLRIDGTVSLIDAFVMHQTHVEDYKNMIKE